MASIHSDENETCDNDKSFEPQIPLVPYSLSDEYEEPENNPRIGDEYQVDIPPLIEYSKNLSFPMNPKDFKIRAYPDIFLIGLPVPLTWNSPVKRDRMEFYTNKSQNLPIPEFSSKSWSDDEKSSFLLGLYIFEKNFLEVKRFVETKKMGEILSFFYGKFYGSDEYLKWSECRKAKSKKVVCGERIFSGSRHKELLYRLLLNVSEENRNALIKVSKIFGDEKLSLVDYVSSLKAMVGMNILVQAFGIGTRKRDLTRMPSELSRSNNPKIPKGEAFCFLTTSEIIKFLSGDYRLSKARSNDLFWEAVWPRLLARGWHSEQPENWVRQCLVFLMPGVNKFSRKLVKGNHFFDSVAEVLSKVAKEPDMIELDVQENDGNGKREEYKLAREMKLEENDDSTSKVRHCYLQPRIQNTDSYTEIVKFTIVDTSLSNGSLRELRSLPSKTISVSGMKKHGDNSSCQENRDVSLDNTGVLVNLKSKKGIHEKQKKKSRNVLKSHSGRKLKHNEDIVSHGTKRCPKLTISCRNDTREFPEILSFRVVSNQETESSKSNSETRPLIDLNLPQSFPEFDNDVITTKPKTNQDLNSNKNYLPESSSFDAIRRHSTRNRPPTSRALEAVANGYLTVKRKRKSKHNDQEFRPVRRAYERATFDSVVSQIEENKKGRSGNGSISREGNEESVSGQ